MEKGQSVCLALNAEKQEACSSSGEMEVSRKEKGELFPKDMSALRVENDVII